MVICTRRWKNVSGHCLHGTGGGLYSSLVCLKMEGENFGYFGSSTSQLYFARRIFLGAHPSHSSNSPAPPNLCFLLSQREKATVGG